MIEFSQGPFKITLPAGAQRLFLLAEYNGKRELTTPNLTLAILLEFKRLVLLMINYYCDVLCDYMIQIDNKTIIYDLCNELGRTFEISTDTPIIPIPLQLGLPAKNIPQMGCAIITITNSMLSNSWEFTLNINAHLLLINCEDYLTNTMFIINKGRVCNVVAMGINPEMIRVTKCRNMLYICENFDVHQNIKQFVYGYKTLLYYNRDEHNYAYYNNDVSWVYDPKFSGTSHYAKYASERCVPTGTEEAKQKISRNSSVGNANIYYADSADRRVYISCEDPYWVKKCKNYIEGTYLGLMMP